MQHNLLVTCMVRYLVWLDHDKPMLRFITDLDHFVLLNLLFYYSSISFFELCLIIVHLLIRLLFLVLDGAMGDELLRSPVDVQIRLYFL